MIIPHQAAEIVAAYNGSAFNAQVPDFAVTDIAEEPQIVITGPTVIDGQVYYLMVVSVKDTGKGSTLKSTITARIRGDNGGGVGSAGQIDIGFQEGIVVPVIGISRKLVKIRQ